ncbi:MAG: hypothetical protein ACLQJR_29695 [Stellaceae bacterium]
MDGKITGRDDYRITQALVITSTWLIEHGHHSVEIVRFPLPPAPSALHTQGSAKRPPERLELRPRPKESLHAAKERLRAQLDEIERERDARRRARVLRDGG